MDPKLLNAAVAAVSVLSLCSCRQTPVSIVPQPVVAEENCSSFRLSPDSLLVYSGDEALLDLAGVWAETLEKHYAPGTVGLPDGFTRIVSDIVLPVVRVTDDPRKADVVLSMDPALAEEEYTLEISRRGINVTGGTARGVWWGIQTLDQVLVQSASASSGKAKIRVRGLHVQDKPHFAYRGAHFDPCRHFFTVDELKTFIDMLALHKLNTLHWHLTDDQGWRLEIEKYPLLTEVGAVRKETKIGLYSDKEAGYDGTPYGEGCYYSRDDVREVLEYASDRQITVIPEIEMPGHAVAALSSYPWLGCTGGPYETRTTWGISEDVFCIGKETTFRFLKDVLDEVCDLFPSEYIHIGGDECPSVRWENCPACQRRMKEEGLQDERQLQGYLLHRIEQYLNTKGKKIIGWDEILEGGVSRTATVMSWRGPQGGIDAARQGNDVIMTPNTYFYLDYYQTADPETNGEPLGIGGYVPLSKCYSFDPYDRLDEDERKHIKGIQANTWTEYIATFNHMQHMDLPRFAALSEVAWSEDRSDYAGFLARVEASMKPMYEYSGYIYAPYAFEGIE